MRQPPRAIAALSVLGQRRRKQRISLNNDPGVASRAMVLIICAHPSNRFRRGLVAMRTKNFGNLIVEKVFGQIDLPLFRPCTAK